MFIWEYVWVFKLSLFNMHESLFTGDPASLACKNIKLLAPCPSRGAPVNWVESLSQWFVALSLSQGLVAFYIFIGVGPLGPEIQRYVH